MSSQQPKKTPPINWKAFEQFMGQPLSFLQEGEAATWLNDPSWVENLVKDAMNRSLAQKSQVSPSALSSEVFETHHNVIVRTSIPESINPRALQLFLNGHQLKIEGLPHGKKHMVHLPAFVLSHLSKVIYKDGVLQVRIRKAKQSRKFREIFIEF